MAPTKVSGLLVSFFLLFLLFVQSHATQPFEFIKNLQGCKKGDKVKGLHELKNYLEHFGYLSHLHEGDADAAATDDFDDVLESAIKTYQLNYNLDITGSLDAETVTNMVSPRCGVPDIIDGQTSMRSAGSNKTRLHHGHQNKSVYTKRRKWPSTHLTYAFLPDIPAESIVPIARAFERWAKAMKRFTFERVQSYKKSDIKIVFKRGAHGDGVPCDGPGGTIAHAFMPTDGQCHFDADEKWSVKPTSGRFHYETIALHEIGHLLGLGHSSVKNAIMFPTFSSGESKDLHGDDLAEIKAQYGY